MPKLTARSFSLHFANLMGAPPVKLTDSVFMKLIVAWELDDIITRSLIQSHLFAIRKYKHDSQ